MDFVSVVRLFEALRYVDVPKLRPRVYGKAMALYERTWPGVITREIVSSVGVPTDHLVREMCSPGRVPGSTQIVSKSQSWGESRGKEGSDR